MKISIIGCGKVGASTAFCLLERSLADELCLVDVDSGKALGDAIDLSHGVSEQDVATVVSGGGEYSIIEGSDIVIIAAGVHRRPGESRLDLVKTNGEIVREVTGKVLEFCKGAIILVVTNPVDVMAYVAFKTANLSCERVFGLGTVLDSMRFKTKICEKMRVKPESVEALIVGEHGTSMVAAASLSSVNGKSLDDRPIDVDEIIKDVRTSADDIVKYKGGTCYAPALAISKVVEAIVKDEKQILPVSTFHEKYGICISLPVQVGRRGAIQKETKLSAEEQMKFLESVEIMKKACKKTGL